MEQVWTEYEEIWIYHEFYLLLDSNQLIHFNYDESMLAHSKLFVCNKSNVFKIVKSEMLLNIFRFLMIIWL